MSQRSRLAALAASAEILAERGYAYMTIDEVARRSGVSKATIYKHWQDGFHLAVEAFGEVVTNIVPTIATGDSLRDLRGQFVRLSAFYASAQGAIATELIAAAAVRADGQALLREAFFGQRRQDTSELIRQGQQAGRIRSDLSASLIIDVIFGPIVFRLFNGQGPLTASEARKLAPVVVNAVTSRG